MNKNFFQTIQNLQQNNLVILRDRRSAADKELLAQLTQGYTPIDLSLPMLSSLAKRDAESFVAQLPLPVYLQNLQYVPQLLPLLREKAVPCTQVLASCTQSFALKKLAEKFPNVRFVDLPVGDEFAEVQIQALAQAENKRNSNIDRLSPFTLEEGYLQNFLHHA